MSWKAFELPTLPPVVATAADSLGTIAQTTTTILGVLKGLVQTLATLEIGNLSLSQQLIQAAVKAIEDNLKSLLTDSGVYVLHVPPRKRIEIPAVVRAAMDRAGLSDLPEAQIAGDLLGLEAKLSSDVQTGLRQLMRADGGNQGFCRTVLESLLDAGDANRPRPLDTDHIYALYILAGADDFRNVLGFMNVMKATFSAGTASADLTPPGLPNPQNVRARQVVDGDAPAALVEWDYQAPITTRSTLDMVVQVNRVAVVRARSPRALSAGTFKQLFGSAEVKAGLKAGVGDNVVEVVSIQSYDTIAPPRSALDKGPLELDKDYYYAAGFELKLGDSQEISQGSGNVHPFDRLSNWSKVVGRAAPGRSAQGTPPDWIRTPSVIGLIPDLSNVLQMLAAQVTQLSGQAVGFGDLLKGHVAYLEQEIRAFEENVGRVVETIQRLTGVLAGGVGSAGAYVRVADGQGGLRFLTEDMTRAFSEEGAPPFTRGTEFVTGVVVLAYAPSAAALVPIKATLDMLFGGAQRTLSVIQQAIARIDVELAAEEAALEEPVASTSAALVGEDDDGTRDLNCPPEPPSVVLGDDFNPQE